MIMIDLELYPVQSSKPKTYHNMDREPTDLTLSVSKPVPAIRFTLDNRQDVTLVQG
jgi:hypothetical protein